MKYSGSISPTPGSLEIKSYTSFLASEILLASETLSSTSTNSPKKILLFEGIFFV